MAARCQIQLLAGQVLTLHVRRCLGFRGSVFGLSTNTAQHLQPAAAATLTKVRACAKRYMPPID